MGAGAGGVNPGLVDLLTVKTARDLNVTPKP
jgi:hypothetical protein